MTNGTSDSVASAPEPRLLPLVQAQPDTRTAPPARRTGVDVDLAKLVTRALSKARLTRKEEEVARLVLKGLTSAEIGAMMGNSEKTIKQHLTQVYAKLGVAGRAEFFHLVFPS